MQLDNDLDWVPGEPQDNDEIGDENSEVGESVGQSTIHRGSNRATWLRKVRAMTDDELFSPKVRATLELLEHVYKTWPGEKVVIFSKMLMDQPETMILVDTAAFTHFCSLFPIL